MARERILIVEGEPFLSRAMGGLLRGREVHVVTHGKDALQFVEGGERFELVLTELELDDMDGEQLQLRIDAIDPAQARRMLFVAGDTNTPKLREFRRRLGDRVIEKPFLADELIEALRVRLSSSNRI